MKINKRHSHSGLHFFPSLRLYITLLQSVSALFTLSSCAYAANSSSHSITEASLTDNSVKTAFCYKYNDRIAGDNIDRPQRIASLTKLFSSYFLLKTRGSDFQYKTFFWVNSQNDLYIQGSEDPYFLEHGIFSIIKTLNENQIYSVRNIYFNQDLIFHFSRKREKIEKKLRKYFSVEQWAKAQVRGNPLSIARQYRKVRELVHARLGITQHWPLISKLKFSFKKLLFKNSHFDFRLTKNIGVWAIKSAPLIEYIKILNSYSNNVTTDEMVEQIGGAQVLESFIVKELNVGNKTRSLGDFHLYTASGLNLGAGSRRKDNLASCRNVLKLTGALVDLVREQGFSVSDLMPTAVSDVGTFSQRFLDWDYAKNFVYKSGTLKQKPTSTLVAVHRDKNLVIVSMAQGGKHYISLKNREKEVLDQVINKVNLKYERIPYSSQEFLMISSIDKVDQNSIKSGL